MFQQVEMSFDEERNLISKTTYSGSDSEKKFGSNYTYDYTSKNGKSQQQKAKKEEPSVEDSSFYSI